MHFKDMKSGYTVYIFDKNDIKVNQGQVVSVSSPYMDTKSPTALMVVDVTIHCAGKDKDKVFTLSEDSDTGYTESLTISTDKQDIVKDILMCKTQCEEYLALVDAHKEKVERYNQVLADFDPAIREKQMVNSRLSTLEDSIGDIKSMLTQLAQHTL